MVMSVLLLSSESMIIREHSWKIDLLIHSKLCASIISLYAGVYHTLVVKDMFDDIDSQKLYMQVSSFLLGVHASSYAFLLIDRQDSLLFGFLVVLSALFLCVTLGFITLLN